MVKVFMSYANENIEQARRLYQELNAVKGIEAWFDKESLMPGMKWRPAIRKAIREANYFLALLSSSASSRRGFVHKEMKEALEILDEFPEEQTYIIPARLDDCEPPFDELRGVHHVDLFPQWEPGVERILRVIRPATEDEVNVPSPAPRSYEYRCAIVDLDNGLTNLSQMCQRLNSIQRFFHFTHPAVRSNFDVIKEFYGKPNFTVTSVPPSFFEQRRYLNADLVACLTRYPLAFEEDNQREWNFFSGPSSVDETFMFMSTDMLYGFTREAGCSFEKGMAYIIIGQLFNYFTNIGYHEETKGCLMDFCGFRPDMKKGLREMKLCAECSGKVENEKLREAVQAFLDDDMNV